MCNGQGNNADVITLSVVGSVRYIKPTYVSFRAHAKIASRVLLYVGTEQKLRIWNVAVIKLCTAADISRKSVSNWSARYSWKTDFVDRHCSTEWRQKHDPTQVTEYTAKFTRQWRSLCTTVTGNSMSKEIAIQQSQRYETDNTTRTETVKRHCNLPSLQRAITEHLKEDQRVIQRYVQIYTLLYKSQHHRRSFQGG